MTVAQVIEALKQMPQDAECFYGMEFARDEDGIRKFGLYPVETEFFERVKSCGSMKPWSWSYKENVVLITDAG